MALSLILTLAAAALALRAVWYLLTTWHHARNADKNGCGAIPTYPSDYFGIKNLRQAIDADKEKLLPRMWERRMREMQDIHGRYVTTFRINFLFSQSIFTVEPRNIQAMLATQFKDFELGYRRREVLHPLLGTGIVCSLLI